MEKGREVGKVLDSSRIAANCKKDEIAELIDRSADEFIKTFVRLIQNQVRDALDYIKTNVIVEE